MKCLYPLVLPVLICALLSACGTKNDHKPANAQEILLLGKWNLQKQTTVVYADGVKQTDTVAEPSITKFGYVQFDAGNSYTSVSYYNSGGLGSTSLGSVIAVDTVKGTFTLSGTDFKLSAPAMAGLEVGNILTGTTGPPPEIHLISQSAQIVQLTGSALTLHIEYTTTQTTNASIKTYKRLFDYYYTR